jgi:hypothetical protein
LEPPGIPVRFTTRYEKTASSFLGVLHLAATLDWIKR